MRYRFFFSTVPFILGTAIITILIAILNNMPWQFYAVLVVGIFLWVIFSAQLVKVSKDKIRLRQYWIFFYTISFDEFLIEKNELKMFLNKKETTSANIIFDEGFNFDEIIII